MVLLYIFGGLALLVISFLAWRITSVGRGARQRDERLLNLLDPIGEKFDAGEEVTAHEVYALAERPELRYMLFTGLREMGHGDLLPHDFDDPVCQAEASLAYWMMHPNELQDPPASIEHVAALTRPAGSREAAFHVFRYRMAEGHWAAKDGWLLGVVGPMDDTVEPYTALPSAFSRCSDKHGEVSPDELVDWWVDLMRRRGALD